MREFFSFEPYIYLWDLSFETYILSLQNETFVFDFQSNKLQNSNIPIKSHYFMHCPNVGQVIVMNGMSWETRDETLMDMYITIICRSWRQQNSSSWWWILWVFVFVLSCSFVGYELVGIFMNGNIQSGVGEFCVVWSSWLDLLCWMSIKFEHRLKLKGRQFFCYK